MRPCHRLRRAIGLGLLLSGLLLLSVAAQANPRYAAIIVEAESGDVLHAANADATRYPASLTKMMTLYLLFEALESGSLTLDQPLPVSSQAAAMPASKLWLPAGGSIRVEEAIQALVVRSANDVAVVVAEALGGSESRFARQMTAKARQLGMADTRFRNASGLPDAEQVTTARDMARLSLALMNDFPQHYHYFAQQRFVWRGTPITGHNRLLGSYPGADGLKTGFIRASGFNVATSAVRHGKRLVSVVMGGFTAASRDRHMSDLLDRGFVRATLSERGDWLAAAQISDERLTRPVAPATRLARRAPDPIPAPEQMAAPASAPSLVAARTETTARLAVAEPAAGSAADPIRRLLAQAEPPAARVASDAAAHRAGGWAVQVGAFRDAAQARSRAAQAAERLASELAEVRVAVAEARRAVASAPLYRAQLVDLGEGDARSACRRLQQQGMECLVVAQH